MVELSTCLDSIKQTVKAAIPDMVNLVSHLALPAIRELCVMKGSARLTENVIRLGKWKNKAENGLPNESCSANDVTDVSLVSRNF